MPMIEFCRREALTLATGWVLGTAIAEGMWTMACFIGAAWLLLVSLRIGIEVSIERSG